MRIAVIGAGFAGLSTAWHLLGLEGSEVVVFEGKAVGGGASGIAAGLLHPYVGEDGKRSLLATEALKEAEALISLVQSEQEAPIATRGIERIATSEEQKALFLTHQSTYHDIEQIEENRFWISSGQTVDCPAYLAGLKKQIEKKGGRFVKQTIHHVNDLDEFDQIVVTAGGGTLQIEGIAPLPCSILKGQLLICEAPSAEYLPECSLISKGYVAFLKGSKTCCVGSTYERKEVNEVPDLSFATQELFPKITTFFPGLHSLTVLDCKAALRVVRKGHYFPILAKQGDRVWVLTAMGSRGLLYHALLGKILSKAVVTNDESLIQDLFT